MDAGHLGDLPTGRNRSTGASGRRDVLSWLCLAMRIIAVALSSALFAALHGRWIVAGLARVIFALVMLHRGRLGDAVQAHLAANLIVALWALLRFDFALI